MYFMLLGVQVRRRDPHQNLSKAKSQEKKKKKPFALTRHQRINFSDNSSFLHSCSNVNNACLLTEAFPAVEVVITVLVSAESLIPNEK